MATLEQNLQRRREDCRRDVLAWLVERAFLAFRVGAVQAGVKRQAGVDYSQEEIVAALTFRQGMTPPQVERMPDPAGTDDKFRATTHGQLAYERDEH